MHTDTDVTGAIIGAALRVSNSLGCGFLEKAYETALGHELRKSGLCVETQRSFVLTYDDVVIGEYRADLIVQDEVIVEVEGGEGDRRRSRGSAAELPEGDRSADRPDTQFRHRATRDQTDGALSGSPRWPSVAIGGHPWMISGAQVQSRT